MSESASQLSLSVSRIINQRINGLYEPVTRNSRLVTAFHTVYYGVPAPTHITMTSFAESAADIRSVRDAVFGQEQRVAREINFDDQDLHCLHVVATDAGGTPIGTGRMQPDGRIGRLSVLKQWRGQGIGARMLEALVASSRDRGLEKVYLHAQVQAIPFYERRGFERDGAEFLEAGMRHVAMTRNAR